MKRKSFILRLWLDDAGNFHGQLSDPYSNWRHPFIAKNELWQLLQQAIGEELNTNQNLFAPQPTLPKPLNQEESKYKENHQ